MEHHTENEGWSECVCVCELWVLGQKSFVCLLYNFVLLCQQVLSTLLASQFLFVVILTEV